MTIALPTRKRGLRRRRRCRVCLQLEPLEIRCLPTLNTALGLLEPIPSVEPNDTLDHAQDLGSLSDAGQAAVIGTLGDGAYGATDVDWYRFTLERPVSVTLTTSDGSLKSPFVSVLSLYNNTPFDFGDPYNLIGHRQIAQADGVARGGDAHLERDLAPGTYYVAVSGHGNSYFSPFLADSGYPGSTGPYELVLTATDLPLEDGAGPIVLSANPAPNAVLASSPLILRVDLSGPLDPGTIQPDQTVLLTYNPSGNFGDGNDQDIPLTDSNFSSTADELQLKPDAPLAPGYYQLFLAGDSSTGNPVLMDPTDTVSLGTDSQHLSGQDVTIAFQVNGVEGNLGSASADDTPATAHDLGDLKQGGIQQVAGVIGDDSTDPAPFNPADVDLYHFHVSGAGPYAFLSEVFARRIGSALNPASSLYRLDPVDQQLHLVAANDDTRNPIVASDNSSLPLFSDSVLYAGLTEGDYYLAVSAHHNVPDLLQHLLPGMNGVFDPQVSHSGQVGATIGPYLLNLRLQPLPDPPQVLAATPAEGATLPTPPTQLTVQFSEPVNLQELAFEAFQLTAQTTSAPTYIPPIYLQGADGSKYVPRLESYDSATNTGTFLMLDGLANGSYQLHFSGPLGVRDFADNPLVGNDASGDYVVHFTVQGPVRGTDGTGRNWSNQEPNDDLDHAQDLGVLFPKELEKGVQLSADFTKEPAPVHADTADFYRFQVLQDRGYVFLLRGSGLPPGIQLRLHDAAGNDLDLPSQGDGNAIGGFLQAGTYVLEVSGWTAGATAQVAYQVQINLASGYDNAPALTVGPAPALRIRLVYNVPANPEVPPPPPPPVVQTPPPVVTPQPPALTSGPPPASAATPAPLDRGSLPQEALLALATGPIGGVGSPSNSDKVVFAERVVVQLPTLGVVEGLVGLIVLTQPSGFGGETVSPVESGSGGGATAINPPARAITDVLFQFMPVWQRAPQILSVIENWWESLVAPSREPQRPSEDETSEARSEEILRLDVADSRKATERSDMAWALAFALLGSAPIRDARKRRPFGLCRGRVAEGDPQPSSDGCAQE